jgi:hypothetical protein
MTRLNTRLAALEKKIQPVKEFVIIDTDGERCWMGDQAGEPVTYLTPEEVKELERTHFVIMVERA